MAKSGPAKTGKSEKTVMQEVQNRYLERQIMEKS